MRRTEIKEGFYWVDRLHYGLSIGKVKRDTTNQLYVVFPGSSACYEIGTADACNPTSIESKRFLAKIETYTKPVRGRKESWE